METIYLYLEWKTSYHTRQYGVQVGVLEEVQNDWMRHHKNPQNDYFEKRAWLNVCWKTLKGSLGVRGVPFIFTNEEPLSIMAGLISTPANNPGCLPRELSGGATSRLLQISLPTILVWFFVLLAFMFFFPVGWVFLIPLLSVFIPFSSPVQQTTDRIGNRFC